MAMIEVRKRLCDINDSIDAINGFLSMDPQIFDAFCADDMYRTAVLYHIAIIGETVNSILKMYPEIIIMSACKIVNTCNYIIHSYDSLYNEILWSIVLNHPPKLKAEIA